MRDFRERERETGFKRVQRRRKVLSDSHVCVPLSHTIDWPTLYLNIVTQVKNMNTHTGDRVDADDDAGGLGRLGHTRVYNTVLQKNSKLYSCDRLRCCCGKLGVLVCVRVCVCC